MIDAWIGNLGKYNEGQLIGEWVQFPTDSEELAKVFDRIGINEEYEEWFLADRECEHIPIHIIGEYSSLDEINYLATLLEDLNYQGDLEKYALVADYEVSDLKDAINLTQCISEFAPNTDIATDSDVGYYFVEELGCFDLDSMGAASQYFDYEAYGRDLVAGGDVVLTSNGMYCSATLDDSFYDGTLSDIPDEYRLFNPTPDKGIEYLKSTELGTEENYNNIDGVRYNIKPELDESKGKTSVLGNLKEGKEAIAKNDSTADKSEKVHDKAEVLER